MRRRTPLTLSPLEDRSVPSAAAADHAPDSILVRLKADAPRVLAAVGPGAELDRPLGLVDGLWQVRLAAGRSVPQALAAARANPFVAYAEPNYLLQVATTPNDPLYTNGTLWGMNRIAMPAAWDVATGGGPVVAVIDTGADYNHPDLAANLWTNPGEVAGNGQDDDGNGYVDDVRGWDFVNNDNNPADDHSHGTHVAGTIAAVGNNGDGVVGVNWAARVMPLKFVAANGYGTTAGAIAALDYAVRNGARVSNHSYGDTVFSQAHLDAITTAGRDFGHLVVAAAGNGDFFGRAINNDTTPFYPASYRPTPDNVLSVAATDSTDHFASFSNYGLTSVDLAAPGVNIYSTVPGGGYQYKSGTSMAAPHVAGAATLLWASSSGLTMTQVRDRLLAGTDPIGTLNPGRPTVTNGRLNVANAITTGPRVSVSDASVTEGAVGTTATATFNVTLSEASTQTVTVNFATADGSATVAGGDYVGTSGTLTFTPGATSLTVPVTVNGDDQPEGNETFTLNLTVPVNARLLDGQGVGTILNDEAPLTLSIADYQATEGNSGTKAFTFTVRLSALSGSPVTVQFATANGTATTGNRDYNATNGTLTIPAGQLEGTITVQVRGDKKNEANETFTVNLSGPTNATLGVEQGVGTILNDD